MEHFRIEGGTLLEGEISVYGAKNSALKIIASTVLTDETCRIENIPAIADVLVLIDILKEMGAEVKPIDRHTY